MNIVPLCIHKGFVLIECINCMRSMAMSMDNYDLTESCSIICRSVMPRATSSSQLFQYQMDPLEERRKLFEMNS